METLLDQWNQLHETEGDEEEQREERRMKMRLVSDKYDRLGVRCSVLFLLHSFQCCSCPTLSHDESVQFTVDGL